MDQLGGKVAVVTGGAGGIGLAMAEAFAGQGMRVAVADIDAERAEAAAAGLRGSGAEAAAFGVDVADPASVEALRDAVLERFATVHLLVNNAGVALRRPFLEATPEDWQWVFSVNVFGVVHGLRAFLPTLAEGPPGTRHVVTTASMSGVRVGVTGSQTLYAGSKFALVGLSEALRAELAPLGIGLSVLLAGPFRTDLATTSQRSRELSDRGPAAPQPPMAQVPADFYDPARVGPMVLDALARNLPYIVTHPQFWPQVASHHDRLGEAFADAARRDGLATDPP